VCIALQLNELYLPIKCHVDALHNFKVMLRAKFKHENEQRAITLKVRNFELWFLCTALHLNKIYLPMKFHVDALHINYSSYAPDKKGRTDRRKTDRQDESVTICHSSGA